VSSSRAKDLRLGCCKEFGGGDVKRYFQRSFAKKSEKRTENSLLLLEKIENFQLLRGLHSPLPTSTAAAGEELNDPQSSTSTGVSSLHAPSTPLQ